MCKTSAVAILVSAVGASFAIQSTEGNRYCLDISPWSTGNAIMNLCEGTTGQAYQWSDGRFMNPYANKCLDADVPSLGGTYPQNHAEVGLFACGGYDSQKWTLEQDPDKSGKYILYNPHSLKCLNVAGGLHRYSKFIIYDCQHSDNEWFHLYSTFTGNETIQNISMGSLDYDNKPPALVEVDDCSVVTQCIGYSLKSCVQSHPDCVEECIKVCPDQCSGCTCGSKVCSDWICDACLPECECDQRDACCPLATPAFMA